MSGFSVLGPAGPGDLASLWNVASLVQVSALFAIGGSMVEEVRVKVEGRNLVCVALHSFIITPP